MKKNCFALDLKDDKELIEQYKLSSAGVARDVKFHSGIGHTTHGNLSRGDMSFHDHGNIR